MPIGDSQRVAACAGSEVDNFFGISVGVVVAADFIFNAGENAEFAFNGNVILMGVVGYFLCQGNILFVGKVASVDHDARETVLDARFAEFEAVAVVEMENNLGILPAEFFGVGNCTLGHIAKKGGVGIVAGAFRDLKDYG